MQQLRLTLEFTDPSGATSRVEQVVTADARMLPERASELLEHLANDFDATLRVPGSFVMMKSGVYPRITSMW